MIRSLRSRVTAAAVAMVVLAAVVLIRTQLLDVATVSSDSMSPTLCTGDTVLVDRLDHPDSVRLNDIVTFPSPEDGTQTIKRVVALGGQSVAIKDALLEVDGHPVREGYVDYASIDGVYFGPVTVPVGSVFVMGDHRETSIDSRTYGAIRTSDINGRLWWDLPWRC